MDWDEWELGDCYTTANKAKTSTIDAVNNLVRVVTSLVKDAKKLKMDGLMGFDDIKTPCTINDDFVFCFPEFSNQFQASGSKRDLPLISL